MAAFNQGWAIRCDDCLICLYDSIRGGFGEAATRQQVEQDAREHGWYVTRKHCFCSGCKGDHVPEKRRS